MLSEDTHRTEQTTASAYEPPLLVRLGTVQELTRNVTSGMGVDLNLKKISI